MDNELRMRRLPDGDVIDVRQFNRPPGTKPYPTKYGIRSSAAKWRDIALQILQEVEKHEEQIGRTGS